MSRKLTPIWTTLLFALIALAIVGLQVYHFGGSEYRQDEIFTLYAAQIFDAQGVVAWMSNAVHPPGWRLLATAWAQAFGTDEIIVRHLSTLFTILTAALVFRLTADLFGRRAGLLAALALAATPLFIFYSYELRPYSTLLFVVAGLMFAFQRWLRHMNFRYALLFVAFGVAGLYTHYYSGIVLAALLIFALIFVKPGQGRYLRGFGLFAAIGLSFTAWMLPFAAAVLDVAGREGTFGAIATSPRSIQQVVLAVLMAPTAVGAFALLYALLLPLPKATAPGDVFRFPRIWQRAYILAVPGLVFAIAFASNFLLATVTVRNMTVMLPALAVVVGFALAHLPNRALAALLIAVAVFSVNDHERLEAHAPFYAITQNIATDFVPGQTPILFETQYPFFYVLEVAYSQVMRLPQGATLEQIFNAVSVEIQPIYHNNPPDLLPHIITDGSPESIQQMAAVIGDAPTLWYIRAGAEIPYHEALADWIDPRYEVVDRWRWQSEDYLFPFTLIKYERKPA